MSYKFKRLPIYLMALGLSSYCLLYRSQSTLRYVFALSLSVQAPSRRRVSTIAVVGGGPSGIFSSIAAADAAKAAAQEKGKRGNPVQICVFEASSKTLAKVKISGGGRCNVLHDTSKPVPELLRGYPRGSRELNGLLNKRFPPKTAQEWFERRGVQLKTESDGRMFPTTDSSQTIIDTLMTAAEDEAGVRIRRRCKVKSISKQEDGTFQIAFHDKNDPDSNKDDDSSSLIFDAVILATGSVPIGQELAKSLGHTVVSPVPSLFTLSTKHDVQGPDGLLHGLSGLSVPMARLAYKAPTTAASASSTASTSRKKKNKAIFEQESPLLVTHHGLSGPAALRLSAFGARELAEHNYRGHLVVHWAPSLGTTDEITDTLWRVTTSNPKRAVSTVCPLLLSDGTTAIPKRLWYSMVKKVGLDGHDEPENSSSAKGKAITWGEAPKKLVRKLAQQIAECQLEMTSKGTFKEEFVTAGGVTLKEVDMTNMQSKVCPGLFFCGEMINVDGVTGGYNFMNCWGTGYVAGLGATEFLFMKNSS